MLGTGHGSHIRSFKFFENYAENQKTNDKYLGYLRFIEHEGDLNLVGEYFTPAVVDTKVCKSTRRKLRMPPVSIENEKKMLTKLRFIADKCLKKYPQTYEEDQELLKDKALSFNKRNCLVMRSGEKRVANCCTHDIDS